MELKCEPLIEGVPVAGVCLALTAPISFWGGVNPVSGEIIDAMKLPRAQELARAEYEDDAGANAPGSWLRSV